MIWQWLLVALIVLVATAYLLRATCGERRHDAAQSGKGVTLIPADQLRLRSAQRQPPA